MTAPRAPRPRSATLASASASALGALGALGGVVPLATAAAVFAIVIALTSSGPAGVFWDDGVYLISARSLAAGEGYRFAHLPGAPSAVHFPPGWPALLAVVWAIVPDFPRNLEIFRLLNPLLISAAAGLACAHGIRQLGLTPALSAAASGFFALTLPVLVLTSVLFAEPLFLCVLIVALMLADRATAHGGARLALVAGAVAGLAALVRSTGLVLVPALVLSLLISRRFRDAAIAAGTAAAVLLPWQWWSASHTADLAEPLRGSYGPYLPWLADAVREQGVPFLASIAAQNMASMQRTLAVVFFPVGVREVRPLLVAIICVVAVLGLAVAWQRARTLVLFLGAYALLVAIWPYAPDRFAWAVWPLAGLVLGAGTHAAWRVARWTPFALATRLAAGTVVAVAALALGGSVFYSARGVSRGWVDIAQRRNAARLGPVVDWVQRHTPMSAVIACDGEPYVHLYTGRRVVPVHVLSPDEYLAGTPIEQAATDLRALLRSGRADFAVLSAGAGEIAAATLLADGPEFPRLIPLDTLPGGGVAYRVLHAP